VVQQGRRLERGAEQQDLARRLDEPGERAVRAVRVILRMADREPPRPRPDRDDAGLRMRAVHGAGQVRTRSGMRPCARTASAVEASNTGGSAA